jgi:hypothetical protein
LLIDERRLWGRFRFAGALGKQVIPPQH